uniref:ABC transport system protein n=1 Tax=Acetithermum autotrophicum TaxID=1446466 RepID=H5SSK2_ACEAU|nr:ABC transport system protein [Candidatus Acetothermum autotrophicum]
MNIIEAEALVKRYGSVMALNGVTLSIRQGELFCFLGPNGAGKSTFLLILCTVLKPTAGKVYVEGYDVTKDPDAVRQRVGIAFQEPKIFWRHTVQEMIDFHIAICGLGRAEKQRAEEILEILELNNLRHRRGLELSGGQQKRLEVARVLIRQPRIAIFDEPTAGIDIHGKHVVWDEINRLKASGSTVILATNDVYEAERLADRVGILDRGNLVACDSLPTLKTLVPRGEIVELILSDGAVHQAKLLLEGNDNILECAIASNTRLRAYVRHGYYSVPQILECLLRRGVEVRGIKMIEPSLDDVFLHFTGRGFVEPEG